MDPIAARSAAERYVAEMLAQSQAIAAVFGGSVGDETAPLDKPDSVAGNNTEEHENERERHEEEAEAATVKRQLALDALDADKIAAWLQGADLPLEFDKSNQSPLLAALLESSPTTQVPSSSGAFAVDWSNHTPLRRHRPQALRPESASTLSTGTSSPSRFAGAAAFFWPRPDEGQEPHLQAQPFDSEAQRLRRLLDPRYRRRPASGKKMAVTARHIPAAPTTKPATRFSRLDGKVISEKPSSHSVSPESTTEEAEGCLSAAVEAQAARRNSEIKPTTPNGSRRPSSAPPGKQQARRQSELQPAAGKEMFVDLMRRPSRRSSGFGIAAPPLTGIEQKQQQQTGRPQGLQKTEAVQASKAKNPRRGAGQRSGRKAGFDQWVAQKDPSRQRTKSRFVITQPSFHGAKMRYSIAENLKNMFHVNKEAAEEKKFAAASATELHQLAVELSMPIADVRIVKEIYDSFDHDGDGQLDVEEFDVAVKAVLQDQLRNHPEDITSERIESMSEWQWWQGDKNGNSITFREFLCWYHSNSFSEEFLLSDNERTLRALARERSVSVPYVEAIKRCFDQCDSDGSGEVDYHEFRTILHQCWKVPEDLDIPPSRVRHFWMQIDKKTTGKIDFPEFFGWWHKFFDDGSGAGIPFEAFYKQVRRIGADILDPPVYPTSFDKSFDFQL